MKRKLVLDIEIYSNYLLVMFKSVDTLKVRYFEAFPGQDLDVQTILGILREYTVISFNGIDFDMPLLFLALKGASVAEVKVAANRIVNENLRGWQFTKQYGIEIPRWVDHIDLREPVPGVQISLKLYGGRLHSKRLQDLPIDPNASISEDQRAELRRYCENDLDTTIDLWEVAKPMIELREAMSAEYGIDLRSKSDAQMAEAVISSEVAKMNGGEPVYRAKIAPGTSYRYQTPPFIKFSTPVLQAVLADVQASNFVVGINGGIDMPAQLKDAEIRLGQGVYRMGIGGLHSSEHCVAHVADADTSLIDRDVTSYYPSIILQCGLAPTNMGEKFTRVYRALYEGRIAAKSKAASLKKQIAKVKAQIAEIEHGQ